MEWVETGGKEKVRTGKDGGTGREGEADSESKRKVTKEGEREEEKKKKEKGSARETLFNNGRKRCGFRTGGETERTRDKDNPEFDGLN